jgi:hypothetical protein
LRSGKGPSKVKRKGIEQLFVSMYRIWTVEGKRNLKGEEYYQDGVMDYNNCDKARITKNLHNNKEQAVRHSIVLD